MKTLFLLASLVIAALGLPVALAQIPLTTPYVLGCTNPAPAAAGKPTVFISKCTTPAFLPSTTTSVIASVSKTAPVFSHTLSGYKGTDLIVACPIGAVVSGTNCTANGVDASALIPQSNAGSFKLPTPVTAAWTVTWQAPTQYTDGTPIGAGELTGYNVYLTPSGSGQTKLVTTAAGVLTYKTQPLAPGTYSISVSALAGTQESAQTGVLITVLPGGSKVPGTPTNVQAK